MAVLKIRDEHGEIIEIASLPGAKGEDGHTPVKGTDYWTEADKAEIRAYVDEQIGAVETLLDQAIAEQEAVIGGEGV